MLAASLGCHQVIEGISPDGSDASPTPSPHPTERANSSVAQRAPQRDAGCVPAIVPSEPVDCSDIYIADKRQWRCVELSSEFTGSLASQVCHDVGNGPQWLTFNLDPADCCACSGNTVAPSAGPPAACLQPTTPGDRE